MSETLKAAIAARELTKRPKPVPKIKKPKASPEASAFQPPPS